MNVPEVVIDIGTIQKGVEFGGAFLFENKGDDELKLFKAYSNIPGRVKVNKPGSIPAGEAEFVYISQDSNDIQGDHVLEVIIKTNDPDQPQVVLTVTGYVQWPVDILPKPVCLIKNIKGETVTRQFEMINNTGSELKIEKIEYDASLFAVNVRELEKGKKFEILVTSKPDAPVGEHKKNIVFHTNAVESPTVGMVSWLNVLERIFTNLQELDFEDLALDDLQNPNVIEWTREIVFVNGMSTSGFKVFKAECDIDFLKVEIDPVSQNNVFRVDVFFDPSKAKKGEFDGSLKIFTNDEEFKEIVLPVHGTLH